LLHSSSGTLGFHTHSSKHYKLIASFTNQSFHL
jgi:hypothetical protein